MTFEPFPQFIGNCLAVINLGAAGKIKWCGSSLNMSSGAQIVRPLLVNFPAIGH